MRMIYMCVWKWMQNQKYVYTYKFTTQFDNVRLFRLLIAHRIWLLSMPISDFTDIHNKHIYSRCLGAWLSYLMCKHIYFTANFNLLADKSFNIQFPSDCSTQIYRLQMINKQMRQGNQNALFFLLYANIPLWIWCIFHESWYNFDD